LKAQGKLQISTTPIILVKPEVLETIRYFVRKNEKECHWFHRVTKTVVNSTIIYHIEDFLVPSQEVTAASVETEGPGMAESWKTIQKTRGLTLQELGDVIKTTACWCHSHVNMGVTPSATDNTQWKEQIELATTGGQTCPQIMMIFNKRDDYFNRVWDPDLGLEFTNVELITHVNIDRAAIDKLIKERIKVRQFKPTKKNFGAGYKSVNDLMKDAPWLQTASASKKNTGNTRPSTQTTDSDETPTGDSYFANGGESADDLENEMSFLSHDGFWAITAICEELNTTSSIRKSEVLVRKLMTLTEHAARFTMSHEEWNLFLILVLGAADQIDLIDDLFLAAPEELLASEAPPREAVESLLSTWFFTPIDIVPEAIETIGQLLAARSQGLQGEVEDIIEDWKGRVLELDLTEESNGTAVS